MRGIYFMNLSIGIAGLMISTLGLIQVLISSHFEQWTKKYFVAFFSIMVVIAVFNLSGQLASKYPDLTHARIFRFTLFWESLLPSLLMLLLAVFLLRSSGETDWKRSRLFHIVVTLWIVYVGLLIYTQFSTMIYSIDDSNVYRRGPLYPLLLVPPVLIMAVNVIGLWHRRNQLSFKQRLAFGIYITIPMISMLIQMLYFGIYTILLGSSVAAVFMFNYIWIDQSEQYYQKVQENKQLRVDIMLSQIQPHFLFNCLNVIRNIYRNDQQKGEYALDLFTKYLRHNMDSVTIEQPIYFEKELKHVRHYLELQQLRFGDELNVVYEISCTQFRLPALTLQPLVENAVTYGIRKKETGLGTVIIRSCEREDCYEVSVTDDGPGFDPEAPVQNDGKSHVGIYNVRERLLRISNAALQIASEPGKGTTATIIIPKGDVIC